VKSRVKAEDRIGQVFGRLTVKAIGGKTSAGHTVFKCTCECGRECCVDSPSIVTGKTASCGCIRSEKCASKNTTHGMSNSHEYTCWLAMKARCNNRNSDDYANYGGRGITVCEEWLESFDNFYADMGEPPTALHSIERRDGSLGYFKDNCYWATRSQQARNTSQNHIITFRGKTQCLAAWASDVGIKYSILHQRLTRYGWTVERALTTDVTLR